MARYDLELVRTAASGRWVEILGSIGGVSSDLLDGRAHPCPKQCLYGKPGETPGGNDRFRAVEIDKGALYCNCCFNSKNGDGFAALQWLTGKGFGDVLESVAKHVGVKADKKKKANPAEHLEFLHWNDTTVGLWCELKQPITPDAVKQVGGRIARYRGEFLVIAIPVWGPSFDNDDAVGWAMYRADGGMLPYYKKKGEAPEWKKILLSPGSQQGIIGDPRQCSALVARQASSGTTDHSPVDGDAIAADIWIKLEGPSDLLTALSQPFPANYKFWTTANGSMEIPLDWIVALFKGLDCLVCHDCDVPGQQGATWVEQRDGGRRPGWAPRLATVAASVKNVLLPFIIEPTHGPDVRDFFLGGGTAQAWLDLLADASLVESRELTSDELIVYGEDNPKRLAKVNIQYYREKVGRNLVAWKSEWYRYKGKSYVKMDDTDLRDKVWTAIENELERWWIDHKDTQSKPVSKVSGRLVSDVIGSLRGMCRSSGEQEMNSWLIPNGVDEAAIDEWPYRNESTECIALENGILSFAELFSVNPDPTRILRPHTRDWFSTVCLPYRYDPLADCPAWKRFLDQVFSGDRESILTLQQWFGYLLTPNTIHEKMLLILGPPRSGKGTIQRVLINMLGRDTVSTAQASDLADKYIKHTWLDKTAVVIPDARFSQKNDITIAITEMLLAITGQDGQDIQRKYKSTLTNVKLNVRFTLFSNVLPRLVDTSAAFITRVIMLSMPNSYLGREDHTLAGQLQSEMSGILNWAIAGRHSLNEQKRFIQPASGQRLIDGLRQSMSPVSAFIHDQCNKGGEVETSVLYQAYCEWCKQMDNETPSPMQTFSKRLRDVFPNIEKRRSPRGSRPWLYVGLSLKEEPSPVETEF